MKIYIAIALIAFCNYLYADCNDNTETPSYLDGKPTLYHGPGSYGPLDRTVSLDSLKYVGTMSREGKIVGLILDSSGKTHAVMIGEYVGENRGEITKIDNTGVYITQHIVNCQWGKRDVILHKK